MGGEVGRGQREVSGRCGQKERGLECPLQSRRLMRAQLTMGSTSLSKAMHSCLTHPFRASLTALFPFHSECLLVSIVIWWNTFSKRPPLKSKLDYMSQFTCTHLKAGLSYVPWQSFFALNRLRTATKSSRESTCNGPVKRKR